MIVDLSVDFDFFVRELYAWDWSHNENDSVYLQDAWTARYLTIPELKQETDIRTWADFMPAQLPKLLFDRNLTFVPRRARKLAGLFTHLGVAESHKEAFAFFSGAIRPPDLLINLDAHHDCFIPPSDDLKLTLLRKVHCGNWLAHLYDKWQGRTKFLQIYPGWKYSADCAPALYPDEIATHPEGEPGRPIDVVSWKDWDGGVLKDLKGPAYIRNMFICRSGVWVPPHHDEEFLSFVKILRDHFIDSFELIGEGLRLRSVPADEHIAAALSLHQQLTENMQ